jgi:acid phosphatase (class A)
MKIFLPHTALPFLLAASSFFLCPQEAWCRTKNKELDTLSFTSTQTWSPRYLHWAQNAIDAPEIKLPPAPKNTSRAIKIELALLHAYQNARTEKNVEEINQEINIYDALFGEKTLGQLVGETERPLTFELMKTVIELESPQIMKQKKIYNRVRPSYLDPTLKPVIDIPPHPAYPSGHATQAQLRALVLSELDPRNRANYLQSAKRIAHNREVAGVHYPSDSKAGFILAQQLFKKLMRNPDFVEHLNAAKAEWL